MIRILLAAAFALGLASVAWVGLGFVGSSWIALAMTAVIGGVYLLGAFEIRQFRLATSSLADALTDIPQALTDIGDWIGRLHPSLQYAVRLRIEGERLALPGLALTPYLVGLLVMLGMLGTFLGMVVTFKGAVFALEGSADLLAIRSALAAPIKGLGLAFGTSVAGVAASAMLGLMSAISRRERADTGRQLDQRIATVFRPFSLVHQRQEAFKALQAQAHALPDVVLSLKAMMDGMERRSEQLDAQLLGRQEQFHRDVGVAYTGLAGAVERTLTDSLAASARVAGESITPVVEAAMKEIAQESKRMHERVSDAAQSQLTGLSTQFSATAGSVADSWMAALQTHVRTSENLVAGLDRALASFTGTFEQRSGALLASVCQTLEQTATGIAERASEQANRSMDGIAQLIASSEDLVRTRIDSETRWTQQHDTRLDQLATLWRTELGALRSEEALRGNAAVERLGELQTALASHLATLGVALEAPLTRLLNTAAEVPQAASGVIAQLRQEVSRLAERDNLALEERAGLVERISTLLQTINLAAGEQRSAIESLVASAALVLEKSGSHFSETLDAQAGGARDVAAQVAASAVELSSLGESFNHGVQLFSVTNEKLMETLQRIEGAIQQSMARSDEQLAYYVAQAREVIDLSITSQQGLVEDLRRLDSRKSAMSAGSV